MYFTQPLITLATFSALCLVILLSRSFHRQTARLVAWLILGALAWQASFSLPFILLISYRFPNWVSLLVLTGGLLIGTAALWFFTNYPSTTWQKRLISSLLFAIGVVWVLNASTPPVIDRGQVLLPLFRQEGWIPPFVLWLLLCGGLLLAVVGYQAFRARGFRRLEARYLLVGAGTLFSGVLLHLCYRLPYSIMPQLFMPALAFLCGIGVLTYIASAQYPLLDIRIILRPLVTFTIAISINTLVWGRIYRSLAIYLVKASLVPASSAYFAIIVLEAITLVFIYALLNYPMSRLLLRSAYHERRIIDEACELLLSAYDAREVTQRMTGIIMKSVQPFACAFYFQDGTGRLLRVGTERADDSLPAELSSSHPFWTRLLQHHQPLFAEEVIAVPGSRRDWLHSMQVEDIAVALPIFRRQGISGCLLCTEKQSGEPYLQQDLHILRVICRQASIALESVEHYQQLTTLNAELEQRVSERTHELAVANDQLQQADTAKNHFLAQVSHELLNPLTGVLGWSEVGLDNRESKTRTQAFEMIKQNGDRLQRLVNDLLDTARIIHGKMAVVLQPDDLWSLTLLTVDNLNRPLNDCRLTVVCHPPKDGLPVLVDAGRMQQVIGNLLINALKFTPEGGTITLTGWQSDEGCCLSIRDTGKGISPDKIDYMFEMFQQAPGDELAGGLGLGLALVRGIVTLHGGTVTATSGGLDQGSTFTITLPALTTAEQIPADETASATAG